MSFNWFDLIVLFGIMQGIISCMVLIFNRANELHKTLLIAIILVLCILSFKIEIHTLQLWDKPFLRYFPLGIDLLIQPILFLYVYSLTKPNFEFKVKLLFHLLPPALFFIHSLLVYLAVLPIDNLHQKDMVAAQWYFNQVKVVEDVLSVGSAFIYGYLCFIYLKKYQHWLHQFTSDTRYPTLNWLRNMLVVTALLGFSLFVNVLIDNVYPSRKTFFRWQFFYLYLTFLIYYLGIKALTFKTEIITEEQLILEQPVEKQAKYENSDLEAAKMIILSVLAEKKIFLDNELTLLKMSQQLGLSPGLASATINQLLGKTFRSLVNEYRVSEVKIRLLDPAYEHLSLLGIALECGFNSEASFYRIFKAEVGYSPKEYLLKNRIEK
ncbi:AraC-like DNA-binding protein [Pedobacter sp. AK013]|uniref:helix-turn-helix domain-containing protein n=1 Tax=Pedobacter sp. AK013 TaxID=2723071 RepID=UPI001609C62D|nr:AraC family transcriptional regulator [Pedobacter sp. AK013]MBB6235912.1 AraC-like DNA-binding protein [Pedobacter sp. AK013]